MGDAKRRKARGEMPWQQPGVRAKGDWRGMAQDIDQRVTQIVSLTPDVLDADLMNQMVGFLPTLNQIWQATTDFQLKALCAEFPGFYRYALAMEDAFEAQRRGGAKPQRDADLQELPGELKASVSDLLTTGAALETRLQKVLPTLVALAFLGSRKEGSVLQEQLTSVREIEALRVSWEKGLKSLEKDVKGSVNEESRRTLAKICGDVDARVQSLAIRVAEAALAANAARHKRFDETQRWPAVTTGTIFGVFVQAEAIDRGGVDDLRSREELTRACLYAWNIGLHPTAEGRAQGIETLWETLPASVKERPSEFARGFREMMQELVDRKWRKLPFATTVVTAAAVSDGEAAGELRVTFDDGTIEAVPMIWAGPKDDPSFGKRLTAIKDGLDELDDEVQRRLGGAGLAPADIARVTQICFVQRLLLASLRDKAARLNAVQVAPSAKRATGEWVNIADEIEPAITEMLDLCYAELQKPGERRPVSPSLPREVIRRYSSPIATTAMRLADEIMRDVLLIAAGEDDEDRGISASHLSPGERVARAAELSERGRSLAEAVQSGLLDDPFAGWQLLQRCVRELGQRYVGMLGAPPAEVAHESVEEPNEKPEVVTVNRTFLRELLASGPPALGLGLAESGQVLGGMFALYFDGPLPEEIKSFRLGHSLMGNDSFVVPHFRFEFYGFANYEVVVDPTSSTVRASLEAMLDADVLHIFAFNGSQAKAFRSDAGDGTLEGLRRNWARIKAATTTASQFGSAQAGLARSLKDGALLSWVCRDDPKHLDLAGDRLELNP
ncbi:MAG: hypothetical protein E6R08_00970 [Nevskiaceae bacterium]|nr:MAG: hypothetical protein E6R08_00970 [Nevskiaceae bacterium]